MQGDTWEWSDAGWIQRNVVGPVPRYLHAMAFDSIRQRTVLFGGDGQSTLADTWEYDGSNWIPRFSVTVPPARSRHGLAFDPLRGRTVMIGGMQSPTGPIWEWTGQNWVAIAASNPFSGDTELAFDGFHGRVLAVSANITRWWNGAVFTSSPATMSVLDGAIAHDESRRRVVYFGGRLIFSPNTNISDTREHWYAPRPAVVTSYGAGCGAPPLSLAAANSSPRIGETFRSDVADVPFGFPFVALGTNNQFVGPFPLPLVLDGFGFQGCLLHHNAIVSQPCVLQSPPTLARHELPIPNVPALLTSRLYLQAWSLAPGVNPGGVVLSNGLEITIGNS